MYPQYVDSRYVGTPQTNLSGPSGYSPADLSLNGSKLANAPSDDSSSATYLGFCILAIVFVLLTGAVGYAILASAGAGGYDSGSADDSFGSFGGGGGGGGGGGFPSGDNGPIMGKDGILLAGGELRPYGIHGEEGGAPPPELSEEKPVKEYICTVGAYAVMAKMYPEDGLCDYLYYTDVAVFNHKVTFTEVELSWTLFQQQAKSLRKTGAGISFDARYVTVKQLRHKAVNAQLKALAANNIKHYGLLNVKARDAELKMMFNNTVQVVHELKSIQSNAVLKVIIAIGIVEHDNAASMNLLNTMFKTAVEETPADTVIVISSSSIIDHDQNCAAIPPLLRATPVSNRPILDQKFPSLKTTVPFVTNSFPLVKTTTFVGLSMEMAVKTYVLKYFAVDASFIPYTPCVSVGLASANIICSGNSGKPNRVLNSGLAGLVTKSDKKTVFYAETLETIGQKVNFLEKLQLRKRFAWLVYNVHLTDIEGRCQETGHARISQLKKLF